jgi:hypothetical protein
MALDFTTIDPLGAFLDGQTAMRTTRERGARRQAGQALAAGDFAGAQDVLGNIGDIAGVRQITTDRQAQGDRERKVAQEKVAAVAKVSAALLRLPEDQWGQAYDTAGAQALQAAGYTPEEITKARQLDRRSLETTARVAGEKLREWGMGGSAESGYFAYDKEDPTTVRPMTAGVGRPPKWEEVTIDGRKVMVDMNAYEPGPGGVAVPRGDYAPGGQGSRTGPSGAPAGGGFGAVIAPLLRREGGFVAQDGRSGAPANFGINQRANPDIDVRTLTPERATQIYKERYWDKINGDSLPPEAQAAVFDAAVNQGPQKALQMWQQSGGDISRFNQLRLEHYRSLPDYAQNGRSWERRVEETGGGVAAPATDLPPGALVTEEAKPPAARLTPEDVAAEGLRPGTVAYRDENGFPKIIQEPPLPKQSEPTVDAKKVVGFTYRVLKANDRLNALIQEGITKPTAWKLVSDKNNVSRLVLSNDKDRRFVSAAKEWLAPILRRDTGAAVTDTEFVQYADMFIPAPEDPPELLKQKAAARQDAMTALYKEGGDLFTETHGNMVFETLWRPGTPGGTMKGSWSQPYSASEAKPGAELPKNVYYEDRAGNLRRNENGIGKGNPIAYPASKRRGEGGDGQKPPPVGSETRVRTSSGQVAVVRRRN